MGKSSKQPSRNQRRHQFYDQLAQQSRQSQSSLSTRQTGAAGTDISSLINEVKAASKQRRQRPKATQQQERASTTPMTLVRSPSPHQPSSPQREDKPLHTPVRTGPRPTPLVLVKQQVEEVPEDACAIPGCKNSGTELCSSEALARCFADRAYKEQLEFFLSH